ncbi:SGNH/GDSL hydrolase family protein [Pedobacter sp. N36a]|uniref:SGNH/GDSL hydrolase family protein n=1 Tax=Pedobacter sp. N36a TaxID=2767996 RepID=UPI001656C906|nr:SGNH/GDSL hydrolase family protein [Pedobacter sp. N36a]MBC8985063.1 SGNH/GDSL hydrolase family protein [Pedobacter sp. N36a]
MKKHLISMIIIMVLTIFKSAVAQESKTWNPAADTLNVVHGRGWEKGYKSNYDRLPADAERKVRAAVWNLAENSAGLHLRFKTDAEQIVVKFTVKGAHQMPHMPATGVSGVDLYVKDVNGKWLWCAGKFAFGDTIQYRFSNILGKEGQVKDREYKLYLPLYNSVKWMEIGLPKEASLTKIPVQQEKPIVVYGTSIAQGACATRPGLAWTSITARKLERPMVNLGFSGNGKLEPEVLDYITQIDAKLYVVDCLPNLISKDMNATLSKKIVDAVRQIQQKRPGVPILLTEHDGFAEAEMQPIRKREIETINGILKSTVDSLTNAGVKNLYLLSKTEIAQDIESMVDGVHPNDIGMMNYAIAYEKKIKSIFKEAEGRISTTIPVTQRRDANTYDWETRHHQVLSYTAAHQPKLVFIGNSITHYWGGQPAAPLANGKDSWAKYFGNKNALNMGFGWDRIENVLWRVNHGELDGFSAQQIVLMIGTNNLEFNTDEEILQGLKNLMKTIQDKQPNSKLLLVGILPRKGMEARISKLNPQMAKLVNGKGLKYVDASAVFLNPQKRIDESLFSDGLHPNAIGYERLGKILSAQLF